MLSSFSINPGVSYSWGEGRDEIAQGAIGSDHANAYQRDGTSKKGHMEKVIFVVASL